MSVRSVEAGSARGAGWRPADRDFAVGVPRLRRALAVAAAVAPRLPLLTATAGVVALFRGGPAGACYFYRGLAKLCERLGPTFIKVAQILQTRRDVLPPALCDALAILQDAVAPLPPATTAAALAEAYAGAPEAVFATMPREPLASGSIACVYRASLHDGREVAIKLRRPGIAAVMAADLALLLTVAGWLARLPPLRTVPIRAVVEQLSVAIHGQLDFAAEAARLRHLRRNLAAVPRVWVPAVIDEACRPSVLVMEFIPGLLKGVADSCAETIRKRLAVTILTAVYRMLFIDGLVHCDLHPGNLYFTGSGFVVVLDAGFATQLSERVQRLLAEFFLNIGLGAGRRCAEIVIASAVDSPPDADLVAFATQVAALVERNAGATAAEFSLIGFAVELFDLQRRFGLRADPEMVLPLLALLVIEGTVRDLDRDVDFQSIARSVLAEALFGASREASNPREEAGL